MSENSAASSSKTEDKDATLSTNALARRNMLLKGLGKGSVVLAATVPLQTLASQSVFTYNGPGTATQIRCGVSGMTSGVHSRDVTSSQCYGYSPGYYHKKEHFPSGTNPDALITAVFPGCTVKVGGKVPTLLQVMNITPRIAEFHWLAAWLNAQPGSPAMLYPYTGSQIQGFYAANDAAAYSFITTYMEKHPGTQYP